MDPAKSAKQFFKEMKNVSGWESMPVGKLCQTVQISEYPDRYAVQVPRAKKICKAGSQ